MKSAGNILPVVLPVPGLGDTGHRAVFLRNHGDAAVSKVCDLRIILPTNGQKRWSLYDGYAEKTY